MLKSSLCNYSDAYMLVKGIITANNTAADCAPANDTNRKVIFKNCAPFTNCVSEINKIMLKQSYGNTVKARLIIMEEQIMLKQWFH